MFQFYRTCTLRASGVLLGVVFMITACGVPAGDTANSVPTSAIPPAKLYEGSTVTNAWTPDLTVVNGGVTNFTKGATVTQASKISQTAGMVRFNDPWGSKEVTVALGHHAAADFGTNGSITLQAEVSGYPKSGGAYAVLSSFFVTNIPVGEGGGSREYVNMASACYSSAGWTCTSNNCSPVAGCAPLQTGTKSSFFSRNDWEQHQIPSFGFASTNSFPRCDSSVNSWACPANLSSLPTGDYYAKYILVSNSGSSVASLSATLNVTPIIKQDAVARNTGPTNGSINLNVVLVGSKNISDSHTTWGARNLDLLFKETHSILNANAGIGINSIKVYEWNDVDGGNYYSQVPLDNVGVMFSAGSQAVNLVDNTKNINIFLVRSIPGGNGGTILGIAGGILGPSINGTQGSGVAFGTTQGAGSILGYNAINCTISSCTRDQQDSAFLEMGATVAHELGHYLGLNHPSEAAYTASSQSHDQLTDTPKCPPRTKAGGQVYFDQLACYGDATTQPAPLAGNTCATACNTAIGSGTYYPSTDTTLSQPLAPSNVCPTVPECQFNHIMWYTTKNRIKVSGVWKDDGSQFSPQSKALLQWSSYVQ